MTKRLVPRHKSDEPAKEGVLLSHEEDLALTALWMENASLKQLKTAEELLDQARKDHRWIACDCRDVAGMPPPKYPPVLAIRKKESGNIRPFRPNNRPEHAGSCPFRTDPENQRAKTDGEREERDGLIDPDDKPQILGGRDADPVADNDDSGKQTGPTSQSARQDGLFKLLAWIIEQSQINRCGSNALPIKEQWTLIWDFTKNYKLSNGTPLYDLFVNDQKLISNSWQGPFYAIAKKTPEGHRPVAYVLSVASSLTRTADGGTEVTTRQWVTDSVTQKNIQQEVKIKVPCEIRYPARDGDTAKEPYLVLIKIVAGTKGNPRLSRGVAQPVVARSNLFPVDSDQERKTLAKLMSTGYVYERKGGYFQVEKPVQGRKADKRLCRPDFLVHRKLKAGSTDTLVVETMGYATEEYRLRKLETTQIMALLGSHLIEDDRTGAISDSEADEKLYHEVNRWLNEAR